MARWKLADSAPVHYVQGAGLVEAGQEFEYDGQPSTRHWLRPDGEKWVPADTPEPAAKPARKGKGAAPAAPEPTPAAVESTDPAPAGEDDAGEF
jgi:hypothetical protein